MKKFDKNFMYLSIGTDKEKVSEYIKELCKKCYDKEVEVEVKIFHRDEWPDDIPVEFEEVVEVRAIELIK